MNKYIFLGKEAATLRLKREKITVQPGEAFESKVPYRHIKHKAVYINDAKTKKTLEAKLQSYKDKIVALNWRVEGLKVAAKARYEEELVKVGQSFDANLAAYENVVKEEEKKLSYFKKPAKKVEKQEPKVEKKSEKKEKKPKANKED